MEDLCLKNTQQIQINKEDSVKYVNELYTEIKQILNDFESQFDKVKDLVESSANDVATNRSMVE